MHTSYHDILIIGAGGAGLMAAVKAARAGFNTACISKVHPTRSHTIAAKGGINASLGNITEDNWQWHMYDTIRGSDWLADHDAVEYMCENAARSIYELEQMGVPFSRLNNGKLQQRIYGGQSSHFGKGKPPHRACSVADRTGQAILQTLYQQSLKHKAQFFVNHFAIDIIMDNGICKGAVTWDFENGILQIFRSHLVIMATGGYGQAYKTNTSSSICTGDGNAMIIRAGLPLQDMEFVQFHPTGLYGSGFLITEAARSEGAHLLNSTGERFMTRYAPSYMELAPRDVISRAMSVEIAEGRGCGSKKDYLLLSLKHIKPEIIKEQLPTVFEVAKNFAGIDVFNEPIPVLPSAHYTMGGIPTNMFCEAISRDEKIVPGLMVIGEAACTSVHGANRLGCNSLLDLIVFGDMAIKQAVNTINKDNKHSNIPEFIIKEITANFDKIRYSKGSIKTTEAISRIKHLTSSYAGVFRTGETLKKALDEICSIYKERYDIAVSSSSLLWNNELIENLEFINLVTQSYATIASALYREESRGAHHREDFPERDDKNFLHHTLININDDSFVTITKRNIRTQTNSRNTQILFPEKRLY